MNSGSIADKLGLRGWPGCAEEVMIARNIALAEAVGARVHMAHVTTAVGVELLRRAKERGAPVTGEVTPHHLTITEEWVQGEVEAGHGPVRHQCEGEPTSSHPAATWTRW